MNKWAGWIAMYPLRLLFFVAAAIAVPIFPDLWKGTRLGTNPDELPFQMEDTTK